MVPFEEFAEMVERVCFNSWRSAVGKDNEALISEVSTILFTKEEGAKWEFSFALRRYGRWAQSKREIEPVEYDPMDPPPISQFDPKRSMSPQNQASQLAMEMLLEVSERLG